jgi:hypothetical protein
MTNGRSRALLCASALLLALGTAGCKDKGQRSAEGAKANIARVVPLVDADVAEIERGLPEGAKKIAISVGKEKDVRGNPAAVRSALLKIRQQVPDLGVAKSTFFALTDDKGVAIRNDLEQDTMAGKNVVERYPALKPLLESGTFVTTTGEFGTPNPLGPDREWVAGTPVKREDGSLVGLLVTGWTYRRFAYHLQESLKRDMQEQLVKSGDTGKLPVIYVLLFDKDAVYGARGTPPVDETSLKEAGVFEKTAAGPAEGSLTITDRAFGWAAVRLPRLAPDLGVVVLRSEI